MWYKEDNFNFQDTQIHDSIHHRELDEDVYSSLSMRIELLL